MFFFGSHRPETSENKLGGRSQSLPRRTARAQGAYLLIETARPRLPGQRLFTIFSPRKHLTHDCGGELAIESREIAVKLRALSHMKKFLLSGLVLIVSAAFAAAQECVMVIEAYSGKVLVGANSSQKRPVASLTKIATASVAVDWASAAGVDVATRMLTVPQTAPMVGGANPLEFQPGDRISLRDALYAALLASDNIAALTIADNIGREIGARRGKGGDPVALFVEEMNLLAKALHMDDTRFANPHGLERPQQKAWSTAADIAKLTIHAMRRNAFNYIVRQQSRQVSVEGVSGGKRGYTIRNSNELIGEPGIIGVKTGTTAAAGSCLSVCMDKDPLVRTKPDGQKGVTPRRLIVVLLNSPDRFGHARQMLDQGWGSYDAWLNSGAPVKDKRREIITVPQPQ